MDNFVCLTICIVHAQAFLRCFDWRDLLKCSRLFSQAFNCREKYRKRFARTVIY